MIGFPGDRCYLLSLNRQEVDDIVAGKVIEIDELQLGIIFAETDEESVKRFDQASQKVESGDT